jgi:hypothetical protein
MANAGCEFRAQESGIRSFVGQSAHRRQPHVYGARSQLICCFFSSLKDIAQADGAYKGFRY